MQVIEVLCEGLYPTRVLLISFPYDRCMRETHLKETVSLLGSVWLAYWLCCFGPVTRQTEHV